jgi:hypothetical protein
VLLAANGQFFQSEATALQLGSGRIDWGARLHRRMAKRGRRAFERPRNKVLSFYCGVDVSLRLKFTSTAGSVARGWLAMMPTGMGEIGGGVEGIFEELDAIILFCDAVGGGEVEWAFPLRLKSDVDAGIACIRWRGIGREQDSNLAVIL